jgi:hypothetical protein
MVQQKIDPAVDEHEMLAHLRRIARRQGWRVAKWRYEGMLKVFRKTLQPRYGYGLTICLLEECAARGVLADEMEPRPAAEVIELYANHIGDRPSSPNEAIPGPQQ